MKIETFKPNLEVMSEIICGKWGIVEPYVKGNTLTYYEWEWSDCFHSKRIYYRQDIDLRTGKFTRRTQLKKCYRYAQHI